MYSFCLVWCGSSTARHERWIFTANFTGNSVGRKLVRSVWQGERCIELNFIKNNTNCLLILIFLSFIYESLLKSSHVCVKRWICYTEKLGTSLHNVTWSPQLEAEFFFVAVNPGDVFRLSIQLKYLLFYYVQVYRRKPRYQLRNTCNIMIRDTKLCLRSTKYQFYAPYSYFQVF